MLRDATASDDLPFLPRYCDSIDDTERELGRFFRKFLHAEFFATKEQKLWTILAVDDHLFDIGPDGSVVRVDSRYLATGNVEQFALGSLYTVNRVHDELPDEKTAMRWLQTAMEACQEFGECIRPPWSFVSTTKP